MKAGSLYRLFDSQEERDPDEEDTLDLKDILVVDAVIDASLSFG